MFPPLLKDSRAIANYIEEWSTTYVDTLMIEECFLGCKATLQEVALSQLTEGNPDNNMPSKSKEKQYSAMNPKTMPPILVENNQVQDGNHRFRVAKKLQLKTIWAYVIS